jgi:hypothetical protein
MKLKSLKDQLGGISIFLSNFISEFFKRYTCYPNRLIFYGPYQSSLILELSWIPLENGVMYI